MRRIGVVTSSRADYGLYLPVLRQIENARGLALRLYATGAHLSEEFGHTVNCIEKDGFTIAARVQIPLSDSPAAIVRAMGLGTKGFADVFEQECPDILLVLGDRYEMHCAAVAAVVFGLPLAHIHGGELTYGAFDDSFRHSLTKLSHLHFASTRDYARRIQQMGEEPWRITVSGAPGLDNILSLPRYSKKEMTKMFGLDFSKPNILVTFHAVTMEAEKTEQYIQQLLAALSEYRDCRIVFTAPNADTYYKVIARHMDVFVKKHDNAMMIKNFGARGYLSMLSYAAVMVGNSSSGIIEAASFKLPVVNIGSRQEGRIRPDNVIDVGYEENDIRQGLARAFSEEFHETLRGLVNPYGDGRAAQRIVHVLKKVDLRHIRKKIFYDISVS